MEFLEFFSKVYNRLASLSQSLPQVGHRVFFIIMVGTLVGLAVIVALTLLGSHSRKLKLASRRIIKYLADKDVINDDNVEDFTAHCFSSKAPHSLRDAWVQFLGVRYGYPSEIVSEQNVFDKEIKRNRDVRANVYLFISLVLLGLFAFWGFGTLEGYKMGLIHCTGLIICVVFYFIILLIQRKQYKTALKEFDAMLEDLDAKVDLQVEHSYAVDTSPLTEVVSVLDEIIARNAAKEVSYDECEDEYEEYDEEPEEEEYSEDEHEEESEEGEEEYSDEEGEESEEDEYSDEEYEDETEEGSEEESDEEESEEEVEEESEEEPEEVPEEETEETSEEEPEEEPGDKSLDDILTEIVTEETEKSEEPEELKEEDVEEISEEELEEAPEEETEEAPEEETEEAPEEGTEETSEEAPEEETPAAPKQPSKLNKMPEFIDTMLAMDNLPRAIKITFAMKLLQRYDRYKDDPEDKAVIVESVKKIIADLTGKKA